MRSFPSSGIAVLVLVLVFLPLWTASVSRTTVYADSPPVRHTGGFGEPSCHRCHSDNPVGEAGVLVEISGMPDRYAPESRYELTVLVSHPDMEAGGFQLSARYEDGAEAGRQAGELEAVNDSVAVATDSGEVSYASHSAVAVGPAASWRLDWMAPPAHGAVVFHVAGNAANHDDSEFGDHVALTSARSLPGSGQGTGEGTGQ